MNHYTEKMENNIKNTGETPALLVFLSPKHTDRNTESMIRREKNNSVQEDELKSLCGTAEIKVKGIIRFRIEKNNSSLLIGKGQAEKLRTEAENCGANLIVFDNDISPRFQRNLEALLNIPVIDRREIIIRIFAAGARTKEAILQIKLAQLEYSLPRLTGGNDGLSQQRGGVKGSRGYGEKLLELDKRKIKAEITKLRKDIAEIKKYREVQRKNRMRGNKKTGAIVGYTNSGKSSLLKKLSGTDIFAEDKLFATLDAETRRVNLSESVQILLTDTVGFVSNLPHQLVDAFRSTLEEAALADFLIIVCDASHPDIEKCFAVTNEVLEDLGCGEKPFIILINKSDNIFDKNAVFNMLNKYPQAMLISVKTGEGLPQLKQKLISLAGSL